MTKPHAQAKSGSARTAQSASQKDILPLEQMMVSKEATGQAQALQKQGDNENDKNQVLVPALRFTGFSDGWAHYHLRDTVVSFDYGLNAPAKPFDFTNKFLRIKDIDEVSRTFSTADLTSPDSDLVNSDKYLALEGDLFFARVGASAGRTYLHLNVRGRVIFIGNLIRGRIKQTQFNPKFIFYNTLSNNFISFIKTVHTSTAQPSISAIEYGSYKLAIPSLPEQQRIGALFKELDRNLSLNRAQLEKLTQLKTSMLEQMFPQEGEDVPRLRFDGFTEPWQQRQLRDLAQIIGGGTPSTSIKAYWDGSINWFTPAELGDQVFVSHSERQITQQGVEQSSAKLLPQGTVLFTSRAGIGKTAILTTPSTTNQGFQSIVPNPKLLDSYFIFSCTNQLKAYGENVGGGSTFKEVSGKQMEVMYLLIPSLAEQERIGAFFQALDERLALQRAKIEKLEQLKKALLEQMFV